ncbi:mobile element transfer protein [Streptomyces sp. HNM0663]|uniref:Mobile element transfer protein n=1 Tax=Streptomyces chengmaiensis TaxID=3040919 RepID=A0ABT6HWR9_9ACTN|nr:mobile element transfer protein [Streptomyces chengmaiensis]MDH2393146.1 mobile element transfer protein [Streptomyces chengmaiensis]
MPRPSRFRDVLRIGPVKVGTYFDRRGRDRHAAACTAPGCGFSADYPDRSAAELAARTHQCRP